MFCYVMFVLYKISMAVHWLKDTSDDSPTSNVEVIIKNEIYF